MRDQKVLIADKDTATRRLLANILEKAGYWVKTTESAIEVLHDILKKNAHVILMGSDLDEEVAAADLIPLLRKCDNSLTIILLSDDKSLPMIRKIRQEGIFYHALRPVNSSDQEEITTAVQCAFKNVLNVLSIH